ncbi:MAG: hypothetical protein NC548_58650 [Lachnospiraceae bacterium]|nr:hypothetical protein [Lachnospiraceae bacterium]
MYESSHVIIKNKELSHKSLFINGEEIKIPNDVDIVIDNEKDWDGKETSNMTIRTNGLFDKDFMAELQLEISPKDLQTSCNIIREELLQHGEFYKAFVKSVQSVIKELPADKEIWSNELAEKIVKRISGEE